MLISNKCPPYIGLISSHDNWAMMQFRVVVIPIQHPNYTSIIFNDIGVKSSGNRIRKVLFFKHNWLISRILL